MAAMTLTGPYLLSKSTCWRMIRLVIELATASTLPPRSSVTLSCVGYVAPCDFANSIFLARRAPAARLACLLAGNCAAVFASYGLGFLSGFLVSYSPVLWAWRPTAAL